MTGYLEFAGDVASKSFVIIGGFLVVLLLTRRASASVRHLLWVSMFVCLIAIPVAGWLLPKQEFARPMPVAVQAKEVVAQATKDVAPLAEAAAAPLEATTETQALATPSFDWTLVLALVWVLGALGAALNTAVRLVRVQRLGRRASVLQNGPLLDKAVAVTDSMRLPNTPKVAISATASVPMTFGSIKPIILLPESAVAWSDEVLDVVLRHECAHIKRRDWIILVVTRLICCFYWPNPLVWFAASKMRAESERAADDLALISGVKPTTYAEALINLASGLGTSRSRYEALAAVEKHNLSTRVKAIIATRRQRGSASTQVAAVVLGLAVVIASTIASLRIVAGVETVDNGRYYLGNGHWVEILAITDMNGPKPRTWNARGQLLSRSLPIPDQWLDLLGRDDNSKRIPPTPRTRYILFRSDISSDNGLSASLQGDKGHGWKWAYQYPNVDGHGYSFSTLWTWAVPVMRFDFPSGSHGQIHVWTPTGDYETYATATFRGGKLVSSTLPGFTPVLSAEQLNPDRTSFVTFSLPDCLKDEQIQVRVEEKGIQYGQLVTRQSAHEQRAIISGSVESVKSVRLLHRTRKHLLFRNIPLEPDLAADSAVSTVDFSGIQRASAAKAKTAAGTIELVGLSDSHGNVWAPDGTKLALAGEAKLWVSSPRPTRLGGKVVQVAFRIPGARSINSYGLWDGFGISFKEGGVNFIAYPPQCYEVHTIEHEGSADRGSFILKSPSAPMKLAAKLNLRTHGQFVAAKDMKDLGIGLVKLDSLHVKVPHKISDSLKNQDLNYILRDAKGTPLPWPGVRTDNDGGLWFDLKESTARRAATIEFMTRPFGYFVFDNVWLRPRDN